MQNVLLAGWSDTTFMIALLSSMEQELPKDSQVTLLNMQPKDMVLGRLLFLVVRLSHKIRLAVWPRNQRNILIIRAVAGRSQAPPTCASSPQDRAHGLPSATLLTDMLPVTTA